MVVAPLAGAWIEIARTIRKEHTYWSLPSRERGLKSCLECGNPVAVEVAPLAGAWIEIFSSAKLHVSISVAPLAGAWIEIYILTSLGAIQMNVAPLAGAWIEILIDKSSGEINPCRSPRGSVD